ncbi:MAG: Serine-type D-Ala-D-Ala carboxypeptidase [Thermomicrobiales bacterium]|jgi:D-alanyl-D-alanine carboxypeptidase|nr:Serine-type D-Ala-D-Ala carboxypeptidase [Thermomicrobiales bacterium]
MPAFSAAADWCRRAYGAVSLAIVLLVATTQWAPLALAQEVPELQITSTNYIAIDAETGEIYAQRGAREHRAPASLTKVFTAIETIESLPPDAQVITSESDLVSEFASQVGFGPGEVFTVEQLLYGMMLPSGNDAARALARTAGAAEGDTDEEALNRFLTRLNQRIKNMGLTDTRLLDPDGWGIPGHYSSAYDLAAFMMYALRYPRFVQAFSTGTYETADGRYTFRNNNRMLRTYEGIIGGKTGYDDDAGWCLINVAERNGRRVIAVTMNGVAPDDWYDDNRVLLDYAFEQQALRAETGAGITGEVVRFRDPDAAVILAMASAGGMIGPPVVKAAADSRPVVPQPVAVPVEGLGASGAGWITALGVAAALIVVQGFATWQLRSGRRRHGPRTILAAANQPAATVLGPILEPGAPASD